ncbi:AfsA-related hotdog domain-containing protein [Paraburkholderia humisilvae]|uniref:A-factor biosynthesis hotdog domain-containing protein n=1 Tax=Paraburkholderia humisilvae TaxID=627669 RepID=A0A6J5FB98_9BURK|nr:AfsA-related hotdog domain-containing protein [Paraburkholderia humisilvae]CAB3774506.1 hypothetical protein LMG29542_07883 [Paraburkholderia humisilvae]
MENNTLILVGDKFANFALSNPDVTTISTLNTLRHGINGERAKILIGQGVDITRLDAAIQLANRLGYPIERSQVNNAHDNDVHRRSVHKYDGRNVLITPPTQIDASTYRANLRVHEDCAEMSDHVTGQHIQGMIFVEAARQLMLSVSENFILDEEFRFTSYFVLNEMRVAFQAFAFPIQIDCEFSLASCQKREDGLVRASSCTQFVQAGLQVAKVEIDFSAYPRAQLERKEATLAEEAVKRYFETQPEQRESA